MKRRSRPTHPLAEVFGFPTDNQSPEAIRHRAKKLCPFNNKVPNCTKDKANDPLGTCSIFDGNDPVITCPIRFRQNWIIADDAASFFFPANVSWTSLTEVRLNDRRGRSAGNIDVVLVSYDERGKILDFGALEVQAVYISGNVRRPFEKYMEDPASNAHMQWSGQPYPPSPDYLSSSRKRLAPQLLFKGGILHAWGKKIAVALNMGFFKTLPTLRPVDPKEAEIAWMIYDLQHDPAKNLFQLQHKKTVYTKFDSSLKRITKPAIGTDKEFMGALQAKLDEKLDGNSAPDVPALGDIVGGENNDA